MPAGGLKVTKLPPKVQAHSSPFSSPLEAYQALPWGSERVSESSWPLTAYDPAHVVGGGPGQTPISDQFMVSHGPANQREIDDFSREVSTTMQNANEEDTQPLNRYPPGSYAHDIRRGDRPLWQQTRRQSRNLMWM